METAAVQVAQQLRERIVSGRWAPGTRLPDRRALVVELDSCLATVQEAVVLLAQEGFLHVGPRKYGTFVAAQPPHLHRYKLVFPRAPDSKEQFWQALRLAAEQRTTPERELSCFYGLSGHRDITEYQALLDEVRTARLAGLIFVSSANELQGTPLLDQPGVPRVAIAYRGELPGIPKVAHDLDSFFVRAADYLKRQGRRRIALLCGNLDPEHPRSAVTRCRRALAAAGLEAAPTRWEQYAPRLQPHAAAHVCELLFQAGQAERPDGLIIDDDNFLEGATQGLLAAGVRTPQELTIVAMTNFPLLLPTAVPVVRLGFDVPTVLDLLMTRLEQLRRGETPPDCTLVPAVFEAEVDSVASVSAAPRVPGGGPRRKSTASDRRQQ